MSAEILFAVGLVVGVLSGSAMMLLRPLAGILLIAAVGAGALITYQAGIPGLVDAFEGLIAKIMAFAPFFVAAAIGKVLATVIAARR